MGTRLLNIRLSPDDQQLVRRLRAKGIPISALMRRALRSEAEKIVVGPIDVDALIDELMSHFPTPEARNAPLDAADRRTVQRHIKARLHRRS